MPRYVLAVGGWKRWSIYLKLVRCGLQKTRPSIFDSSEREQERSFELCMLIAYRLALELSLLLACDSQEITRHRWCSRFMIRSILEAYPDMKATLLDLPSVIKIAQRVSMILI